MEIAKRIIALIEILGLTPGEFADKINVQRSGISHITSGRNKPSLDFLERTMSVFPDINSEWLILGKGRPLKSQNDNNISVKSYNSSINNSNSSPLLFPIDSIENTTENRDHNTEYNITKPEKNKIVEEEKYINKEEEKEVNEKIIKEAFKDKKREIKKILILYTDGSFETFEN